MVPATLPAPAAKATPTIPSLLALDLGTTTGWAIRTGRCRIVHGTAEFRPSRFEGGGMRYLRFGKWLDGNGGGKLDHGSGGIGPLRAE